jgi:hypothetical protein
MIALVTVRFPGTCYLCKEAFVIGETAFRFHWHGRKILACELCTEECLPKLHPTYEPPRRR